MCSNTAREVLIKKPVECGMQKTYQSHKGPVHGCLMYAAWGIDLGVNRYYISLSDLLGLGGRWIFELGGNAWWFDWFLAQHIAIFSYFMTILIKPMENQKNAVTAQGRTDPNQTTGISIQNCTIDAAPDLANDLNSTSKWNGTLGLDTIFYGEFNNYGPGSITDNRVQWPGYFLLNDTQSWNFTVLNFTLGNTWLPDTDIPYTEGLLK
ncbi:putative pectinesterase/pectinesterase inhibitor [Trifolium repens]|nr:putative pectinesterase/pectinesterase inhibitor [Trifolium repens]